MAPTDPSDSPDSAPPVDVEALVDEIRARLGAEAGADPGTDGGLPEKPATRCRSSRSPGPLEIYRHAVARPATPGRSHRPVVGVLVSAMKAMIRPLVHAPLAHLFARADTRETASFAYGEEVYQRLVGMEADLRTRLERVEARQALELETLRRRLEALERTLAGDEPEP